MPGYKGSQPMNTAWLVARKWDRIDMGEYSALAMFRKLEVIYWAVERAEQPSFGDVERGRFDLPAVHRCVHARVLLGLAHIQVELAEN